MIPEIPERTSHLSSIIFLIGGLFFIIYPISGILKNDLAIMARPGGKGYHMHGLDATVIGTGIILLGISSLMSAIRNVLEERQREQNFYRRSRYPSLYKFIRRSRNSGLFIMLSWSLVSCSKSLIDFIHN